MLTLAQEQLQLLPMLDRLLGEGRVPPGARGLVSRLIDQLRFRGIGEEGRALLEQFALDIDRLECALRRGDREMANSVHGAIRAAAHGFIDGRLRGAFRF